MSNFVLDKSDINYFSSLPNYLRRDRRLFRLVASRMFPNAGFLIALPKNRENIKSKMNKILRIISPKKSKTSISTKILHQKRVINDLWGDWNQCGTLIRECCGFEWPHSQFDDHNDLALRSQLADFAYCALKAKEMLTQP